MLPNSNREEGHFDNSMVPSCRSHLTFSLLFFLFVVLTSKYYIYPYPKSWPCCCLSESPIPRASKALHALVQVVKAIPAALNISEDSSTKLFIPSLQTKIKKSTKKNTMNKLFLPFLVYESLKNMN